LSAAHRACFDSPEPWQVCVSPVVTKEEESKVLLLELKEYDVNLIKKVKWLALNKIDLISKEKQMKLKEYFDKQQDLVVSLISAKNRIGTENLMKEVGFTLEKIDE